MRELAHKKVSTVWKGYGYNRSDAQQIRIKCKKCKTNDKWGNTTNLFHYLKQKHLIEYKESQKLHKESSVSSKPKYF